MKTLKDRGFNQERKARKRCPAGYTECAKAGRGQRARKRERDRLTDRHRGTTNHLRPWSPSVPRLGEEASPKSSLEIQNLMPRPVWLSWLGVVPQSKRSPHVPGFRVWSPVKARTRGNQSMFLSCIDVSLPLFPFLPLSLNIKKRKEKYRTSCLNSDLLNQNMPLTRPLHI